ncbi:xanthine dehydrogenase accessory protein XdhC [Silicimonas algicola]|uniref:Molybdenum cofactor sulfurylase n=1 Tax=Silicimonas algicola TaxID=1826607 RepID=A0A316G6I0_9RHOB|nr:xanthine dehydrogenase accessory protein XdhC [Silicimonas algicola]AZQ69345.1 xanthine dehydrogenase accessory protein XdhC [Silicimonas algicola]PWK56408.1 molybdenum cofactor sulfurylase [Silicimonas algicola]
MSFAVEDIRRLAPVARIVVAETKGSVPREAGAAMLVTAGSTSGTIGGGTLEFEAIRRAREALAVGRDRFDRVPLGPALGQCCGGAVSLLTEVWDEARLAGLGGEVVARPIPGASGEMPLAVRAILADVRGSGLLPKPGLLSGWMIEPVSRPSREVWIWGAGHVGRALVSVLSPLPGLRLCWADSGRDRFPEDVPAGVETLVAENPAELVTLSGPRAEHFVLTYSHALDLELCHRILSRPFGALGLIGSATKRARFRSRLAALGHPDATISRMVCPIGDPALGKHPQAIALGVATRILAEGTRGTDMTARTGAGA